MLVRHPYSLGLLGQLDPFARLDHRKHIRHHNQCSSDQDSITWLGLLDLLSSKDHINGSWNCTRRQVGTAFLQLDFLPIFKQTSLLNQLELSLIGTQLVYTALWLSELELLFLPLDYRIASLALEIAFDQLRSHLSGLGHCSFDLNQFPKPVSSQASYILYLMKVIERQVEGFLIGKGRVDVIDEGVDCLDQC